MMSRTVSTFLVFIAAFQYIVKCDIRHLEIDDICLLDKNGTTGRCKLLTDCPYAQRQLRSRTMRPQLCGFQHITPIVCCAKIDVPPPQVTTEQSIITHPDDRNKGQNDSKSYQKCMEYANFVYKNQSSPILLPGILWEIANTCEYDEKMTNSVTDKEFPHMVSLGYNARVGSLAEFKYQCTGALISEEYILTTASCTNLTKYGLPKVVRLGTTILQENYFEYPEAQMIDVQEFIRHPKFNETTKANDIALIKLSRSPVLNSYARPGCISKRNNQSKHVISVGFGSMNTGVFKNTMKKDILNIDTRNTCSDANNYSNSFLRVDLSSCNFDECVLDLGSPLVVYNEQPYCTYTIVGLLSHFRNDCTRKMTGYVTDVSKYVDWIEANVWA